MSGLRLDLTSAARRLAEAPGFTVVCILTLALGIGGNTAVFTLIDDVLMKPLPVQRPWELYRLGNTDDCCVNTGLPGEMSLVSYDLYLHLRDAAPEFEHLAAFQANTRAISIGRPDPHIPPETLDGAFVSGNYFQLFEPVPAAGRLIQPSDDRRDAAPVAVISHRAWTERFQGRVDIVGSPITLNGVAATIVGVAPQGFYGDTLRPEPADLWVPLAAEPLLQPASRLIESLPSRWLYVMGRLAPGHVTETQARVTAALRHWLTTKLDLAPDERKLVAQQQITIVAAPGGVSSMRDEVAPALRLLQALAAGVLLIACANLASLLLARGLARRTETAVRVALGASRTRLVGQFLIESVLLACLGGLVGMLLAATGARAIIDVAFRGASHVPVDASPSLVVVGFAFAVSLATGVVFGVAPAVLAALSDPVEAMRGAGRTSGEHGAGMRRLLIALQVAMSLVLLASAGLLARSLRQLEAQDFGFSVDSRYVATVAPSLVTVPSRELPALYRRIRERLMMIPGVVNVAYSLYSPMSGDNWSSLISVEGRGTSERLMASWNRVSPGYFETIGTPILRGRAFDEKDRPGTPLVAVVSQAFARTFFADNDPIGRRIGFAQSDGTSGREYEIVGIVGDAKYQDGRRPPYNTFFIAFLQQSEGSRARAVAAGVELDRSHYPQALEIQTNGFVRGLESAIRRALADLDRRIVVRSVIPLDEQVARAFNLERLIARLTVAFGAVALLLACLGLYGVTAYSVSRRTREIGIRVAIGAPPPRVVSAILRGALLQLGIGLAIGLPAAFAAGRMLQARLFGVSAYDPLVLSMSVGVLGTAAVLAALLPAARAAGMDPVRALRVE